MDGNISFVLGTQIDGVITRDVGEVPVAKILNHVSPAELERYENQDFFDEDERERLLPPKKPRGRPRFVDRIVPSFNIAPVNEETSREQSLLLEGPISMKRKVGRPKGSFNKKDTKVTSTEPSVPSKVQVGRPKGSHKRGPHEKKADKFTSTKPSFLSESSTFIKEARGQPPRQKNLSVVIPSFNGPQPQKLESTPGAETESDEVLGDPKPQYSMVIASGLGQSDTEEATSRDQSVELVSSSKKRRLVTSNAFIDLDPDIDGDERSLPQTKRAKLLPETSPDPIANDSAALIRQFQARVYGPDHSAKGSTIPHQQSKPSSTLNDSTALFRQSQAHTRSSSHGSSSSDSLMGPTPRPLKPLPAQYVPNKPLPGEETLPQRPPPGDNLATIPASYPNNCITASHFPRRQPVTTTPTKISSPSRSIQRKVSLTPHFPPGTSFSHNNSLDGSSKSTSQTSSSSASRHAPSQPANTIISQSSRIMPPSPPEKRKLSPELRSAPPHSSQASSTSKIGFTGPPREKAITDYFAPKAAVAETAPTETAHSPSLQLLGPENSESEDQLARESSHDSISSEIIVVRQNRVTPTNQAGTAEARPQEASSNDHDRIDLDSSEDDSSEDESEDEHHGTNRVSNTVAPVRSTASPVKMPSSAENLNRTFEIEDDEDSDSDSDSESSEVMIVRPS